MQQARQLNYDRCEEIRLNMVSLRSYLMTVPSHRWTVQGLISENTGINGVAVRTVCQAYPSMFVSSTEGYKLTKYATAAEIQHCVSTLLSRSEKMIKRASALSRMIIR